MSTRGIPHSGSRPFLAFCTGPFQGLSVSTHGTPVVSSTHAAVEHGDL